MNLKDFLREEIELCRLNVNVGRCDCESMKGLYTARDRLRVIEGEAQLFVWEASTLKLSQSIPLLLHERARLNEGYTNAALAYQSFMDPRIDSGEVILQTADGKEKDVPYEEASKRTGEVFTFNCKKCGTLVDVMERKKEDK